MAKTFFIILSFSFVGFFETAIAQVSSLPTSPLNSPKVSVNSLFSYQNSSINSDDQSLDPNGFRLRETELVFTSDVDPYSRLMLNLAIHPEYELNANGELEEGWIIEPEEAYVESDVVRGVTLKGGKFRAAFGKSNLLHTHALPFYDEPLVNSALLGDEGLNDVGVSASYLIPISFFSELTFQVLRGGGENTQFSSATQNDSVGLLRFRNLWDLNESSTIEAGASFSEGANSVGGSTQLYGIDTTFKWRPTLRAKSRSLVVSAEWIGRNIKGSQLPQDERKQGLNLWTMYQLSERWYSGLRYDQIETSERWTVATEFRATEFTSFTLDFSRAQAIDNYLGIQKDDNKISLQGNFTIGAHPAHAY